MNCDPAAGSVSRPSISSSNLDQHRKIKETQIDTEIERVLDDLISASLEQDLRLFQLMSRWPSP